MLINCRKDGISVGTCNVDSLTARARELIETLVDREVNKTGCDGMVTCCKNRQCFFKRNVWNVKWSVSDQEDLERGCAKNCQAHKLNREDAMDRSIWRKLITDD